MSLQQTFIANLRYFRKKKGLTQKDLSVYLNKGYNYINCIEGGNSFPPPDVIDQMAAILEVEPGLLFQKDSSPENLRRYGGQQTADIIEETLSSAVDLSGAGRPAAHSFGRECAAGLFSFKSVFRSSSRQCAGWK